MTQTNTYQLSSPEHQRLFWERIDPEGTRPHDEISEGDIRAYMESFPNLEAALDSGHTSVYGEVLEIYRQNLHLFSATAAKGAVHIGGRPIGPVVASSRLHESSSSRPNVFSKDWFLCLTEKDPGVFYVDGKKYVFLQSDKDLGNAILTLDYYDELAFGFISARDPKWLSIIFILLQMLLPDTPRFLQSADPYEFPFPGHEADDDKKRFVNFMGGLRIELISLNGERTSLGGVRAFKDNDKVVIIGETGDKDNFKLPHHYDYGYSDLFSKDFPKDKLSQKQKTWLSSLEETNTETEYSLSKTADFFNRLNNAEAQAGKDVAYFESENHGIKVQYYVIRYHDGAIIHRFEPQTQKHQMGYVMALEMDFVSDIFSKESNSNEITRLLGKREYTTVKRLLDTPYYGVLTSSVMMRSFFVNQGGNLVLMADSHDTSVATSIFDVNSAPVVFTHKAPTPFTKDWFLGLSHNDDGVFYLNKIKKCVLLYDEAQRTQMIVTLDPDGDLAFYPLTLKNDKAKRVACELLMTQFAEGTPVYVNGLGDDFFDEESDLASETAASILKISPDHYLAGKKLASESYNQNKPGVYVKGNHLVWQGIPGSIPIVFGLADRSQLSGSYEGERVVSISDTEKVAFDAPYWKMIKPFDSRKMQRWFMSDDSKVSAYAKGVVLKSQQKETRVCYYVEQFGLGAVIHRFNIKTKKYELAFVPAQNSMLVDLLFDESVLESNKIEALSSLPFYQIKKITGTKHYGLRHAWFGLVVLNHDYTENTDAPASLFNISSVRSIETDAYFGRSEKKTFSSLWFDSLPANYPGRFTVISSDQQRVDCVLLSVESRHNSQLAILRRDPSGVSLWDVTFDTLPDFAKEHFKYVIQSPGAKIRDDGFFNTLRTHEGFWYIEDAVLKGQGVVVDTFGRKPLIVVKEGRLIIDLEQGEYKAGRIVEPLSQNSAIVKYFLNEETEPLTRQWFDVLHFQKSPASFVVVDLGVPVKPHIKTVLVVHKTNPFIYGLLVIDETGQNINLHVTHNDRTRDLIRSIVSGGLNRLSFDLYQTIIEDSTYETLTFPADLDKFNQNYELATSLLSHEPVSPAPFTKEWFYSKRSGETGVVYVNNKKMIVVSNNQNGEWGLITTNENGELAWVNIKAADSIYSLPEYLIKMLFTRMPGVSNSLVFEDLSFEAGKIKFGQGVELTLKPVNGSEAELADYEQVSSVWPMQPVPKGSGKIKETELNSEQKRELIRAKDIKLPGYDPRQVHDWFSQESPDVPARNHIFIVDSKKTFIRYYIEPIARGAIIHRYNLKTRTHEISMVAAQEQEVLKIIRSGTNQSDYNVRVIATREYYSVRPIETDSGLQYGAFTRLCNLVVLGTDYSKESPSPVTMMSNIHLGVDRFFDITSEPFTADWFLANHKNKLGHFVVRDPLRGDLNVFLIKTQNEFGAGFGFVSIDPLGKVRLFYGRNMSEGTGHDVLKQLYSIALKSPGAVLDAVKIYDLFMNVLPSFPVENLGKPHVYEMPPVSQGESLEGSYFTEDNSSVFVKNTRGYYEKTKLSILSETDPIVQNLISNTEPEAFTPEWFEHQFFLNTKAAFIARDIQVTEEGASYRFLVFENKNRPGEYGIVILDGTHTKLKFALVDNDYLRDQIRAALSDHDRVVDREVYENIFKDVGTRLVVIPEDGELAVSPEHREILKKGFIDRENRTVDRRGMVPLELGRITELKREGLNLSVIDDALGLEFQPYHMREEAFSHLGPGKNLFTKNWFLGLNINDLGVFYLNNTKCVFLESKSGRGLVVFTMTHDGKLVAGKFVANSPQAVVMINKIKATKEPGANRNIEIDAIVPFRPKHQKGLYFLEIANNLEVVAYEVKGKHFGDEQNKFRRDSRSVHYSSVRDGSVIFEDVFNLPGDKKVAKAGVKPKRRLKGELDKTGEGVRNDARLEQELIAQVQKLNLVRGETATIKLGGSLAEILITSLGKHFGEEHSFNQNVLSGILTFLNPAGNSSPYAKSPKQFLRKAGFALPSQKASIMWGAGDDSKVLFSVTEKGLARHGTRSIVLTASQGYPEGKIEITRNGAGEYVLSLDAESELYQSIETSLFGPVLDFSFEIDEAGKKQIAISCLHDKDFVLLESLFAKHSVLFTEPEKNEQAGSWKLIMPYDSVKHQELIKALQEISVIYEDSINQSRQILFEQPSAPEPPGPAPGADKTPRKKDKELIQKIPFIKTHDLGVGLKGESSQIRASFERHKNEDGEVLGVWLKKLVYRDAGLDVKAMLERKGYKIELVSESGSYFEMGSLELPLLIPEEGLAIRVQKKAVRADDNEAGFESCVIKVSASGDMTIEELFVTEADLTHVYKKLPVSVKINQKPVTDIFSFSFKVVHNPLTEQNEIVAIGLALDSSIVESLKQIGINPKHQIKLNPPVILGDGIHLNVSYPGLGVLEVIINEEGPDLFKIERKPLSPAFEISAGEEGVNLIVMTSELMHEIALTPCDDNTKKTGKENWYHVSEGDEGLVGANSQLFLNVMRLLGLTELTTAPEDGGLIVIAKKQQAKSKQTEIELFTYQLNPDGTKPVIFRQLSLEEYQRFVQMLEDPAQIGASSLISVGNLRSVAGESIQIASQSMIMPGDSFMMTTPSYELVRSLFFEKKSDHRKIFEVEKELYIEFVNGAGLVISVPVKTRRRKANVFYLDSSRPIKTHQWGKRQTTEIIRDDWMSRDEKGKWVVNGFDMNEAGELNPFELRCVVHPKNPALICLLSSLPESQEIRNDQELYSNWLNKRQGETLWRLELTTLMELGKDADSLPAIYALRRSATEENLTTLVPKYISDDIDSHILRIELTGFKLKRATKAILFDSRVSLKVTKLVDKKVVAEQIELQHTTLNYPGNPVLFTEVLNEANADSAPRRFLWLLDSGGDGALLTVPDNLVFDDAFDFATLLEKLSWPKFVPQTIENPVLDFDPRIPVINEKNKAYHLPKDEQMTKIVSRSDLATLLESYQSQGLSLADDVFMPLEESLWAQMFIGREKENMTFVTKSGLILMIPMELLGGTYRHDKTKDSFYGIVGARLIMANPENPKEFYEIDSKVFSLNQTGNDFQLILHTGYPPVTRQLKRVTLGSLAQAGVSRSGFGFQIDSKTRLTQNIARAEIKGLVSVMGLDKDPVTIVEPGLSLELDDWELDLKVVKNKEGKYVLTGESVEFDDASNSLNCVVSALGIDETGDIITSEWLLERAEDDSSLFYITNPHTNQVYSLCVNALGQMVVRLRSAAKTIREYYQPVLADNFTSVGITGHEYGSIAAKKDKTKKASTSLSFATRNEVGQTDEGQPVFEVSLATNRWKSTTRAALLAGADSDVDRMAFNVFVDDAGELKTSGAVLIDGVTAQETKKFPWGEEAHVEIHEDKWVDETGKLHRGRVRVVFWLPSVQKKSDKSSYELVPYGWLEFESREALVGGDQDFCVTTMHHGFDYRYRDRKIAPQQTGFLSKRAGVVSATMEAGFKLMVSHQGEASQDDVKLTKEMFEGATLFGKSIAELLGQTRARQTDVPILLSALYYLHTKNPDWGLFDDDLNYSDQNLARLVAFSAIEFGGVNAEDVLYVKGSKSTEVPVYQQASEDDVGKDFLARVETCLQEVRVKKDAAEVVDVVDDDEDDEDAAFADAIKVLGKNQQIEDEEDDSMSGIGEDDEPIKVDVGIVGTGTRIKAQPQMRVLATRQGQVVSKDRYHFTASDFTNLLRDMYAKDIKLTSLRAHSDDDVLFGGYSFQDRLLNTTVELHFIIDKQTGVNRIVFVLPGHEKNRDDSARIRYYDAAGILRRLNAQNPFFMRFIDEVSFVYPKNGVEATSYKALRDTAEANFILERGENKGDVVALLSGVCDKFVSGLVQRCVPQKEIKTKRTEEAQYIEFGDVVVPAQDANWNMVQTVRSEFDLWHESLPDSFHTTQLKAEKAVFDRTKWGDSYIHFMVQKIILFYETQYASLEKDDQLDYLNPTMLALKVYESMNSLWRDRHRLTDFEKRINYFCMSVLFLTSRENLKPCFVTNYLTSLFHKNAIRKNPDAMGLYHTILVLLDNARARKNAKKKALKEWEDLFLGLVDLMSGKALGSLPKGFHKLEKMSVPRDWPEKAWLKDHGLEDWTDELPVGRNVTVSMAKVPLAPQEESVLSLHKFEPVCDVRVAELKRQNDLALHTPQPLPKIDPLDFGIQEQNWQMPIASSNQMLGMPQAMPTFGLSQFMFMGTVF